MVHSWTKHTDGTGSTVRVFLFDYRKAFDLIDHAILARKLLALDMLACEQALCLGKKNSCLGKKIGKKNSCLGKKIARKGKGREGGREPVDTRLRPLFRPLVIILPNICQQDRYLSINFARE